MRNQVRRFIEKEQLLTPGAKVLIGLSGGADSVVLLHILHELGYDCIAAHCNFHLRGEESDRDDSFVNNLTASWGIPLHTTHFDTTTIAKERSISIEMAARELRYAWFDELRQETGAEAIAVGHHRDDNIETLLLNLIRGTGIAGLSGMKPKNGVVVRPLLCITREDIQRYSEEQAIPYIIDSTNLEDEYTRNKIRLQVIPLLESINPSVKSSLAQTLENLSEANRIYDHHIREMKQQVWDPTTQQFYIPTLLNAPSTEALLFEILKEYGFNREVIRTVYQSLQGQSGKEFYSPTHRLLKDRDSLYLSELSPNSENESDTYYIEGDEIQIDTPFLLEVSNLKNDETFRVIKEKRVACLDKDKLRFPLTLRKWQPGDRFVPFGMKGSQKLSDYFNNNKLSRVEKENSWVLCSGEEIVWLVGHRVDDRYAVRNGSQNVYLLKLLS